MAGTQPLDVPEEKTSLIPVQGRHMERGDINNNNVVKPKRLATVNFPLFDLLLYHT